MAFTERNLRMMLILAVCLTLWNLSSCAVIRRAPSWDDDKDRRKNFQTPSPSFDWNRFTIKPFDWDRPTAAPSDWNRFIMKPFNWDRPTAAPFDWNKFSIKPFDWDRPTAAPFDWNRFSIKPFDWDRPTVAPFDWNRFSLKPFDWDRFTVKPFDWNKFTLPPDDYYYKPANDTSLKLAIFLPTLFGAILILICKYFVCTDRSSEDTSTLTLHPPPRRTAQPPQNGSGGTAQNARQHANLRTELFSTAPNRNSRGVTSDSSSRSTDADKPPGYSDVVISDLCGGQNHFPEVKPTIPETPPPQYDEKNIMRY